jgi:16S rRNA (adenine1518-N6/adenine1519-N6)-dimethyltransferase
MRQNLGQHFLNNKGVLRRIAETVAAADADTIIEIGPGHGELTEFLVASFQFSDKNESHLRLFLIERDPTLAEALRTKFADDKQISVIEDDVLDALGPMTHDPRLTTYAICGNLPYYLTGHLLRLIGELPEMPAACVFTIQKEVAERLAAKPPRMNRLAAAVQFWAEPKVIGLISRKDFSPPPEVDSATVMLKTRPGDRGDGDSYYRMVRILFQQPRKTIGNNLAAAGLSRENIAAGFAKLEIDPGNRPQDLGIEQISKIAEIFHGL